MIHAACASVILTAISTGLYLMSGHKVLLTLAITFITVSYQLLMRLCVGHVVDKLMRGKADYTKRRYKCSACELGLYEKLRVKRWKDRMPTYTPDSFNHTRHSFEEIVRATCQAETVHEVNIILSFVPVCLSIWFGEAGVFIATSILAAMADLSFVMIQRYNRPRLMRLIGR